MQDSTWAVLSVEFRIPPAHMPEYDFMEVKQEYGQVGDSGRMITRQQFNYYIKTKKEDCMEKRWLLIRVMN